LRSVQHRARGTLARAERFDVAGVVRSCVILERPLARKVGIALHAAVKVSGVFLRGDPNTLYQTLTALIRNAVTASVGLQTPVVVSLDQDAGELRLTVEGHGKGATPDYLDVVEELLRDVFRGGVRVDTGAEGGSVFTIRLPIPPQRGNAVTFSLGTS